MKKVQWYLGTEKGGWEYTEKTSSMRKAIFELDLKCCIDVHQAKG